MESELLFKEDKFYKENEKLEFRTKELMLQVNDVMKIQENIIKEALNIKNETLKSGKIDDHKHCKKHSKLTGLEENVFQEEVSNNTALLKVYKTKFKSLTAESERLQNELRYKNEELKKLQKDFQSLKEEKEKWFLLFTSGKNTIGKFENQISSINAKLLVKESENSNLKKELDQLKKQLKNVTLNSNNIELRLTRAIEEGEKCKIVIKQMKDEEKEYKDSCRKQLKQLAAQIKTLDKQKLELLNGFKKQMQLINVLKRQKANLEVLKISDLTEAEYLKILECKF
ncbi:hypothetical protein ABEB36_015420 [Hypothenemus hampei]|uniref:Uncharacterized protein n=1 Tax=Hypothenemus hampei TaxID=57062 RepID=A0ABD1E141_HYPHA